MHTSQAVCRKLQTFFNGVRPRKLIFLKLIVILRTMALALSAITALEKILFCDPYFINFPGVPNMSDTTE